MTYPVIKVKLTKPGESITLVVTKCGLAAAGKYPEVEFTGKDGDRVVVVPVPESSANRQLARIPFSYEECVGASLRISRDPNPTDATKAYWGIVLAGNGKPPVAAADPHADIPHPADIENGKTETAQQTAKDIYLAITKHTLAHVVPLYVAAKIPIDMQAVASMVATRFIAATRNGHG